MIAFVKFDSFWSKMTQIFGKFNKNLGYIPNI